MRLRPLTSEAERELQIEHLQDNLARHSARGGTITIAAQFLKTGMQVVTIAVLGRLLNPETFGLIAMVAAILTFLEFFKDLGLSSATVQRGDITQAQVSAFFWINVALGVAAAIMTALLAPILAWFYGQPSLTAIALWLSLGFVISGLTTQHLAILRRQMRFGALAAIQLLAEGGGMAMAVFSALLGAGYWSLVAQRLAWISLMAVSAWLLCRWRPDRPEKTEGLRHLIGFGGNITASNLINFFARNLDQILIGWYWGANIVGMYERATKLVLVPINNINTPLFAVLMPTLSRLTDDPVRYRQTYLRALEKLVMLTMPAAALLIALPNVIVRLLFGPGWAGATPIVLWLGVTLLYQPASYTSSWLFISQNRTRDMFYWSVIGSALSVLSFILAVSYGAVAVAASFSVTGLVLRTPILFWLMGRKGPVASVDLYRALLPSAITSVLVYVSVMSLQHAPLAATAPVFNLALSTLLATVVATASFLGIPRSRRALQELGQLRAVFRHREVRE